MGTFCCRFRFWTHADMDIALPNQANNTFILDKVYENVKTRWLCCDISLKNSPSFQALVSWNLKSFLSVSNDFSSISLSHWTWIVLKFLQSTVIINWVKGYLVLFIWISHLPLSLNVHFVFNYKRQRTMNRYSFSHYHSWFCSLLSYSTLVIFFQADEC